MENRVPRTLYRQLLSWCRRYQDVPFDGVPPLTLTPPQVNSLALRRLKSMRTFLDSNEVRDSASNVKWRHPAHFALYNSNVAVEEDMIVFPAVHNASELRDVIRSVYWLNNVNTMSNVDGVNIPDERECESSSNATKEQISLAFDAIKSCNQLSSSELDSRRNKRLASIEARRNQNNDKNAPIVEYHVGQVVSQKKKGWRGVIVGWTIEQENANERSRLTSLTTKKYSLSGENETNAENEPIGISGKEGKTQKFNIKYTILVDVNDAALLKSSKIVSLESQEDLGFVEPCLHRIHNNLINQYFNKFESDHFVPNNVLGYVYPMDRYSSCDISEGSESSTSSANTEAVEGDQSTGSCLPDFKASCMSIIQGVNKISNRLVSSIEHDSTDQNSKCNFLESLLSGISTQAKIDVDQPTLSLYSTILALYHFHVKINSLLWSRKIHVEHKPNIKFSLGQIVRHKLYDYRGVIIAWDPKPHVDVTNWDGLQHVDNPQNQPFYHIRPDENDCIRAFGGPRSFRYVCQDNVELCEPTELEVDELSPQEWRWDKGKGSYVPSDEMKFLYGEELESDETMTEQNLQKLRDTLSECLLTVRDGVNNEYFTMDDLFCVLRSADTLENATAVQDTIKEIWKESSNIELRNSLDTGIAYLLEGNFEKALSTFTKITEADPSYGEAWNKKATVHYMMGHMQESLEAARRALDIDPRNFQALAGIGLVEMDSSSSVEKAVDAFRQCLALNPWSMVSARLALCLRKRDRSKDINGE